LVYFTLDERLSGVNVHERSVVHEGPYNLVVNNAALAPEAEAADGCFLLPWQLPPGVAEGKLLCLVLSFMATCTKNRLPHELRSE
jgi:hypothetical protein